MEYKARQKNPVVPPREVYTRIAKEQALAIDEIRRLKEKQEEAAKKYTPGPAWKDWPGQVGEEEEWYARSGLDQVIYRSDDKATKKQKSEKISATQRLKAMILK